MKMRCKPTSQGTWAILVLLMLVVDIPVGVPAMAYAGAKSMPTDVRRVTAVNGVAAAGAEKSIVCGACHGADGNATVPGYPSLAGQPAAYLYLQLASFARGWRTNAIMQAQIAAIGDKDFRNLAAYYASLPRHASIATTTDASSITGKSVYSDGQILNGVPPCQGCHGSAGEGLNRRSDAEISKDRLPANYRTYPVLAGLSSGYVVAQLAAFRAGTRSGTSNAQIMRAVAGNIDQETAVALGNYLETLSPP